MYLTRNQAYVYSVPGVRIPPSPPDTHDMGPSGPLLFWGLRAWARHGSGLGDRAVSAPTAAATLHAVAVGCAATRAAATRSASLSRRALTSAAFVAHIGCTFRRTSRRSTVRRPPLSLTLHAWFGRAEPGSRSDLRHHAGQMPRPASRRRLARRGSTDPVHTRSSSNLGHEAVQGSRFLVTRPLCRDDSVTAMATPTKRMALTGR